MRAQFHDRPRAHQSRRRRSFQLSPIGYNDVCLAADVVAAITPDWKVELINNFPGETSLVIMPEDAADLIGPTFVVYQEPCGFRLDRFQWDTRSELGEYPRMRDAMLAVVTCLIHLSVISPVYSTLSH
jgi:hypothetical protein